MNSFNFWLQEHDCRVKLSLLHRSGYNGVSDTDASINTIASILDEPIPPLTDIQDTTGVIVVPAPAR